MPTIQAIATVPVNQTTAFDQAHDYRLRQAWDPFIRNSRLLDTTEGEEIAVGDRVWARVHNGLAMTVRYEAIQRPTLAAMQMTRGPWFFRKFTGVWRFSDDREDGTKIVFRYGFEARPTWLAWLFIPPLRFFLQRDIDRRLGALADYLQTMNQPAESAHASD